MRTIPTTQYAVMKKIAVIGKIRSHHLRSLDGSATLILILMKWVTLNLALFLSRHRGSLKEKGSSKKLFFIQKLF